MTVLIEGQPPVLYFDGDPTGSADCTTALNSALTAISAAGGGVIFFPPGRFKFESQIAYTIPSGTFSVSFVGAGADVSILFWPSGNGIAITATETVPSYSVHFRDLSITTQTTGGNTAVSVTQTGSGSISSILAQSDFTRVTFRGDTINSDYWDYAIVINGASNFSYDACFFYGNGSDGTGIFLEGNGSIAYYYSIVHNICKCGFFSLDVGLHFGDYVQGVTVSQCNFQNGVVGIYVPSSVGALAQLTISDSQFNTSANQIDIETYFDQLFVIANLFDDIPASHSGVYILSDGSHYAYRAVIQGNTFVGANGSSSLGITTAGSSYPWTLGMVTGNIFDTLDVAVDLTGATGWNVQSNVYRSGSGTIIHGTGNTVGGGSQ